jgi:hypothetical protein
MLHTQTNITLNVINWLRGKNVLFTKSSLGYQRFVHVMLFRCTLGVSDWEKSYLYLQYWTLGFSQWLITGRGMCVYIIINSQWINKQKPPDLLIERKICVECAYECWWSNYKAISLNLTEKIFSVFFREEGRYNLVTVSASLHWKLFCCILFSGTLEREKIQKLFIILFAVVTIGFSR